MSEHKDDREFFAGLKSDVRESFDLYFAPVRAVMREFQHAIEGNGHQEGGDSSTVPARDGSSTARAAHDPRS